MTIPMKDTQTSSTVTEHPGAAPQDEMPAPESTSPTVAPPELLPEIVSLVLERLGAIRAKRSLLNFMLGSKASFELGLPWLWRDIEVPSPGITVRAMRRMLADCMGSNKFQYVKSLTLLPTGYEWPTRFEWSEPHTDLLRVCLPYVEHLTLRLFKKDGPLFREILNSQPKNLKHLSLTLYFVYALVNRSTALPPNVKILDLDLDSDMEPNPLLEMLDDPERSPSLEEVNFSGSWWPNTINLSLTPNLASKIRTMKINCRTFHRLRELPPVQLRNLTLEDASDIDLYDWQFVEKMETLKELVLDNLPTSSQILTLLPRNLVKLTLKFPQPTLAGDQHGRVKAALDRIENIEIVCRGNPAAVVLERELWHSLARPPKVRVVY